MFRTPQTETSTTANPSPQCSLARWDFITPEYPPEIGGLADYTQQLAQALSRAGALVHVWAPGQAPSELVSPSLVVFRTFDSFRPSDLLRVDKLWKRSSSRYNIFLQWTPTGYRYDSLNIFFCLWILLQVIRGHSLRIMFHEFAYNLSERKLHMKAAAIIHRCMAALLVNCASHSFTSSSLIAHQLTAYSLSGRRKIQVLPIPSNVPQCLDLPRAFQLRGQYASAKEVLIGHFGLWSPKTEPWLMQTLPALLDGNPDLRFLFIGKGSDRYHNTFVSQHPALASRVSRTGPSSPTEVAEFISACDCMFQPYADGVTTKRGSAMAALANGRFLISTQSAETEAVWQSTPAVSLINVGNGPNIASQVATVLASPCLISQGSAAARSFYDQNFSLDKTVSALLGAPEPRAAASGSF